MKPPKFVSYIKSPPLSDAASWNTLESISCTQDTLLLRIIRWYILSTIWMLQNNSLVSHQQLADYIKLSMIYSICGPTFLNEHRKVMRTLFHIWKTPVSLSQMLWRTFVGTFPLSTTKRIIAQLYTPDDFVSLSLFSSSSNTSGALHWVCTYQWYDCTQNSAASILTGNSVGV